MAGKGEGGSGAVELEVWQVPTPLPVPVLTAGGWYDTFFHVVAITRDAGTGQRGWGFSAVATAAHLAAAGAAAVTLTQAIPQTLGGLLTVEHVQEVLVPDAAGRAAACALALAGWDLAARRLGVACADLWGRLPHTDDIACYASGLFLDASHDALIAEAEHFRSQGHRLVKMRTGLTLDEDLARFDTVRHVFPEDGSIAVDAFHLWDPGTAVAFMAAAPAPLLWVEDPTPYDVLNGVAAGKGPIAAGESLGTLAELQELVGRCRVDDVILDVQQLGGPMRFLAAAHAFRASGTRVGSHISTCHSTHLLACVPDPLPVEVFDWSDALTATPLTPDDSGRVPVVGPGFGMAIAPGVLDAHGTRIV